jgi:hypothetical protein
MVKCRLVSILWRPVRRRAISSTRTDTPLIETPQSISIITREEMDLRGVHMVAEALSCASGRRRLFPHRLAASPGFGGGQPDSVWAGAQKAGGLGRAAGPAAGA